MRDLARLMYVTGMHAQPDQFWGVKQRTYIDVFFNANTPRKAATPLTHTYLSPTRPRALPRRVRDRSGQATKRRDRCAAEAFRPRLSERPPSDQQCTCRLQ